MIFFLNLAFKKPNISLTYHFASGKNFLDYADLQAICDLCEGLLILALRSYSLNLLSAP